MRSDPTSWILARASGLVAYALLTSSVLAGIVLKARPFGAALKAAAVADLHRFLAMLGLGFIALHASALVLDSTVRISVPALFVPGLVPYRPLWSALGVLAADLLLLGADPLADIRNVRRIERVIARGRVNEPDAVLDAARA